MIFQRRDRQQTKYIVVRRVEDSMKKSRVEGVGHWGMGCASRLLTREGLPGKAMCEQGLGPCRVALGAVHGENVLGTLSCSPRIWWVLLGVPEGETRKGSTHSTHRCPATPGHKTSHPSLVPHAVGDSTSRAQGRRTTPETFLGSRGYFWRVPCDFRNRALSTRKQEESAVSQFWDPEVWHQGVVLPPKALGENLPLLVAPGCSWLADTPMHISASISTWPPPLRVSPKGSSCVGSGSTLRTSDFVATW